MSKLYLGFNESANQEFGTLMCDIRHKRYATIVGGRY